MISKNYDYESEYRFTEDYSVGIEYEYNFGDTISYEYNLKKGEEVLYKEEVEITYSDESNQRKFEYSLTVSNIRIVKDSETEDYQVYRDGELEEDAVIEILQENGESTEADMAFCRKGRDIKITFADETSVILSELIGEENLAKLEEIFSSMYDMYFVNQIVDRLAHEVHMQNSLDN